ncbi:hypothetical protein AYO38_03250 [bacterium SCGC AG-212-C10]|nr:hypothetical protein AYO38_03250 [bacterium SCGC AG-212-C10]
MRHECEQGGTDAPRPEIGGQAPLRETRQFFISQAREFDVRLPASGMVQHDAIPPHVRGGI